MRLLTVVLVLPLFCVGQNINVESYAPNPSSDLTALWQLQIDLSGGGQSTIWLRAEVKNRGQLVYHSTTEVLTLNRGLNVLDQFKVPIKQQSFTNKNLEGYVLSTGKLPKGLYTGCVTIFNGQQEVKTLCVEIQAENFSPPMLVFPFNQQEITESSPTLSWIPPVPNAPGDISYSVKLSEVLSGQTAQEAILKNPARFFETSLQNTMMPYPASALPLEVGKSYAWQVEATVGNARVGITEVWSFKVVELNPEIKELISKQDYFDLGNADFSRAISALKLLKLKYTEAQTRSRLTVRIYDVDGKEILKKPLVLKNNSGENYHDIDLTQLRGIKHDTQYMMTVEHGAKGMLSQLSFVYLDPEKYKP